MDCPDCKGTGENLVDHVHYADGRGEFNVPMKCSRCVGIGVVDDRVAEWMRIGANMREERLAKNRSGREEAKLRGMTAKELNDMEWGKIEPKQDGSHG